MDLPVWTCLPQQHHRPRLIGPAALDLLLAGDPEVLQREREWREYRMDDEVRRQRREAERFASLTIAESLVDFDFDGEL